MIPNYNSVYATTSRQLSKFAFTSAPSILVHCRLFSSASWLLKTLVFKWRNRLGARGLRAPLHPRRLGTQDAFKSRVRDILDKSGVSKLFKPVGVFVRDLRRFDCVSVSVFERWVRLYDSCRTTEFVPQINITLWGRFARRRLGKSTHSSRESRSNWAMLRLLSGQRRDAWRLRSSDDTINRIAVGSSSRTDRLSGRFRSRIHLRYWALSRMATLAGSSRSTRMLQCGWTE